MRKGERNEGKRKKVERKREIITKERNKGEKWKERTRDRRRMSETKGEKEGKRRNVRKMQKKNERRIKNGG